MGSNLLSEMPRWASQNVGVILQTVSIVTAVVVFLIGWVSNIRYNRKLAHAEIFSMVDQLSRWCLLHTNDIATGRYHCEPPDRPARLIPIAHHYFKSIEMECLSLVNNIKTIDLVIMDFECRRADFDTLPGADSDRVMEAAQRIVHAARTIQKAVAKSIGFPYREVSLRPESDHRPQ